MDVHKTPVKHILGEVYYNYYKYYMVIQDGNGRYALIDIRMGTIVIPWYETLEEMDKRRSSDIHLNAKLIVE